MKGGKAWRGTLAVRFLFAAVMLPPAGAAAEDVLRCSTLNGRTECVRGDDEAMFPGEGRSPVSGRDEAAVSEWNRRWGGCRWDGAGACRDYFGRVVELSPLARPPER